MIENKIGKDLSDILVAVEVFPSNIKASIIKYRKRTLVDIPESEKVKPDVTPFTRGI
jgi:hypothetical protein